MRGIHWGSVAIGLLLGFAIRHYMQGRAKVAG
jgi:hypothetical protein